MKPKIINRKEQKKLRQSLRNNSTSAEKLLWSELRRRKLGGLKFRRQCGISNYIVDFYCPELKLVIELDGDIHGEEIKKAKDNQKEKYITSIGMTVMRFTNGEIFDSMDGVLLSILSNHPLSPSSKEGEP
jgi:very-short-patch-repair endonuclease